jgi:uncharacterized membrane protein YkvA (DUF1232 family)
VFGVSTVWAVVISLSVGLLAAWIALVIALLSIRPEDSILKEALRILPDTLRLLRRIAADPLVPTGVRARIYALFVYLAIPIDLIPDFLPVIGYADDAILIAMVLRSVVHRTGPETVHRHWPGTDEGLAALRRIASLPTIP